MSEVRSGEITWQGESILDKLKRTIPEDDSTIYIYSRHDDVAIKNSEIIDKVEAETKVFKSRDTGKELLKGLSSTKNLNYN